MAFCPQKPVAVSAVMSVGVFRLFLFASDIGFPLSVGMMEGRPTSLRMVAFTPCRFPGGLVEGVKKR